MNQNPDKDPTTAAAASPSKASLLWRWGFGSPPAEANAADTTELLPSTNRKQCFTPLQTRLLWAPLVPATLSLCPSMDLVVFGLPSAGDTAAATSTLWLHRTMTWQKLATLAAPQSEDSTIASESNKFTTTAWRPDGRVLAVAAVASNQVLLYRTEDLLQLPPTTGGAAAAPQQAVDAAVTLSGHTLQGLAWVHTLGRPHPAWRLSDTEQQARFSQTLCRTQFAKNRNLVPQQSDAEESHGHGQSSSALLARSHPTSTGASDSRSQTTSLSVLCAITAEQGLQLFLQGQYPVLSQWELPIPKDLSTTVDIQASNDLSLLLLLSNHQQSSVAAAFPPSPKSSVSSSFSLTLVWLPTLARHGHFWQRISSLYSSVTSHLEALQQGVKETSASFSSSLRPLDVKLDGLTKLLRSYNLLPDGVSLEREHAVLCEQLIQFIVSGQTQQASTTHLDQFFTSVPMNDQLLQRMERSLQVAVANVERQVRRQLVAPAQALVGQTGELHALARYVPFLLSVQETQHLKNCAQVLLISAETALTELVEARFRLQDFCAWLRAAGSHIKARGTAPGSVQRENAKKRRVTTAVVQRILRYLQQPSAPYAEAIQASPTNENRLGVTEALLGISFSQLLCETPSVQVRAATSSAVGPGQTTTSRKTPTVPYVVNKIEEASGTVFAHPRTFLSESIQQTELVLESSLTEEQRARGLRPLVATTTRLGRCNAPRGGPNVMSLPLSGFFSPRVVEGDKYFWYDHHRQWCLVAMSVYDDEQKCDCVQLHAVPLTWTTSSLTDDKSCEEVLDEEDELEDPDPTFAGIAAPKFVSTLLQLPPGYTLRDIAFYSDDGKSSLSSDTGTGQEGRQSLGLLVSQDSASVSSLQLWIVPYDDDDNDFNYLPVEMAGIDEAASANQQRRIPLHVPVPNYSPDCRVLLQAMTNTEDDDDEPDSDAECPHILSCKTREVSMVDPKLGVASARLALSGSRGIGAVFSRQEQPGGTSGSTLHFLDLEEDEEADDESDGAHSSNDMAVE